MKVPRLDPWMTPQEQRALALLLMFAVLSLLGEVAAQSFRRVSRPTFVAQKIGLNTASLEHLTALPGIGPKTAALIVQAREERLFASLEELQRVSGIGPKTLERLRPLLVLD